MYVLDSIIYWAMEVGHAHAGQFHGPNNYVWGTWVGMEKFVKYTHTQWPSAVIC